MVKSNVIDGVSVTMLLLLLSFDVCLQYGSSCEDHTPGGGESVYKIRPKRGHTTGEYSPLEGITTYACPWYNVVGVQAISKIKVNL